MSDLWVLNASPLIVFGKIGQLDLRTRLAEDIVSPQYNTTTNQEKPFVVSQ